MADELTTKPTLDTLLEMMRDLRDTVNRRFDVLEQRLDGIEDRLERLETRMDRVESMALEARADLRDLKKQLKEHLTALK
jgi:hypothetical protein